MEYARERGLEFEEQLGAGFDGVVYSTTSRSAIKALRFELLYQRERDVYLRLQERNVTYVSGFAVPKLIRFDDRLWVVEMSTVNPPFALDFAGAFLDRPLVFTQDELIEWEAEKQEQFGERWPRVRSLMSAFRGLGIYLGDVKPGNITFANED